jgi:hypothetical protein
MAEWSMAVVLKTTVGATPPGVRIPLPPPTFAHLANQVSYGWQANFWERLSPVLARGTWRQRSTPGADIKLQLYDVIRRGAVPQPDAIDERSHGGAIRDLAAAPKHDYVRSR